MTRARAHLKLGGRIERRATAGWSLELSIRRGARFALRCWRVVDRKVTGVSRHDGWWSVVEQASL